MQIKRKKGSPPPGLKRPPLFCCAVVLAALIDRHGQVLIQQRPSSAAIGPDLWEFPGGKMRPEESPEQALCRELDEELAIDCQKQCLAPITFASGPPLDGSQPQERLLLLLYAIRIWKGTPEPRAASRLAWVVPQRLGDYPMPPLSYGLAAILRDLL